MNCIPKSFAVAALSCGFAFANDLTPQQLKALCETSPNNTVVVSAPLKVTNFSSRVNVTTGCRLVFGLTGKFEADSINMGFAGPLALQGGLQSSATLVKTLFEAPSISFDLAGGENILNLAESTVRATTGNVVVNAGASSQFTVTSRFAGRTQGILAAGSIQVAGGGKFDVSISETTLAGNAGIGIAGSGAEMTLSIGSSNLISTTGAISITSPGTQATMNYALGQMRAATGVTVSFSGNEGQVHIQNATVNSGSGSASFVTALSGARPAKTILVESNVTAGGSVTVSASAAGESGEAAIETSRVVAAGEVVVRSGPRGTTNVKLNNLRSNTLVGAYTGPSGSCLAEGNTVLSPAQSLCLP